MELLQFRYFLEAARLENLTKAAEELHIAQPALSQSLKRLETELGVSLFDRKSHRVTLNDQGRLLERRLSALLPAIDHLKEELWESVYASERTVRLNFFAASPFITECIIAYRGVHPEVNFQVSQLEATDNCDIHVDSQVTGSSGAEIFLPEGYVKQTVLQEEVFLAVPASSRFAGMESVDLRETEKEKYIRLGHSWQLRNICDDYCRRAGIQPQIIFESNSPESVRNLIAAGLGIGFWPEKSWCGFPGPQVVLVPIRHPVCRRDILVTVCASGGKKPVVEDFYRYMCEYWGK